MCLEVRLLLYLGRLKTLVFFQIQEDAGLCGNDFATSALTVELNKQTLDTMLDGLGRIRDQLSTIANK